jgi:hypothetical protein
VRGFGIDEADWITKQNEHYSEGMFEVQRSEPRQRPEIERQSLEAADERGFVAAIEM